MGNAGETIALRYFGLSLGEIEILFNMLRDPFEVNEQVEENPDERYVSVVNLDFPLSYDRVSSKHLAWTNGNRSKRY